MEIVKRSGEREKVNLIKICARITKASKGLNLDFIDPMEVAKQVIGGVYDGVTTRELDEQAVRVASSMASYHPDYMMLASCIAVSALHKDTKASFSDVMKDLHDFGIIDDRVMKVVRKNGHVLDNEIDYKRDYTYDIFGFSTLMKSYLLKIDGKVVERPQHMIMRVAIGIHFDDIEAAIETYNLISKRFFTHATPTLFNAGTKKPQLSSCFLLQMKDDSIHGIYETNTQTALISQHAGGIGLSIHNIRGTGSAIKGTNGISNGIVPMLRVFNETARYVDQGGGKRKGSFAIYIEPWHPDIFDFLDLKKNRGKEERRCKDLFLAIWMNDLFMKRVEEDSIWSLFCPNEIDVDLSDMYGSEFEENYLRLESGNKFKKQVSARKVWEAIIESQMETGVPYILFKDSINEKSNQKNIGVIKSSNLCAEIVEYTSKEEVAVCNLASISLPTFVNMKTKEFDFKKLYEVAYRATKNLNKVIDVNYYPIKEAKTSNIRHRPVGLGIQGLADIFMMLKLPFESKDALKLSTEISETIYYAALRASCDIAKIDGPYDTFEGSPLSKGLFQFDMWKSIELGADRKVVSETPVQLSDKLDWEGLRKDIMKHGVRNSLVCAYMPTASTSNIMGNKESFDPDTSNIYKRKVLSGEFSMINKHIVRDLVELKLWSKTLRDKILEANGSIRNIPEIPDSLKEVYKTAWEISQKSVIDLAAARGPFVDQTQSMNLYLAEPNAAKVTSMLFYAWHKGLKTGMYYLRRKGASAAEKFTISNDEEIKEVKLITEESDLAVDGMACSLDNPEACESCSG